MLLVAYFCSMACSMGTTMMHSFMPILEIEGFERPFDALTTCAMRSWIFKQSFGRKVTRIMTGPSITGKSYHRKRHGWSTIALALETGGVPDNGGQEVEGGDSTGLGRTRLGRIFGAGGKQLLEKLNGARRNFPMKIFLLLLGFYTANALATILGQTGDWDVLVAGIVVAAIEGIGMLMYRKSLSESIGRLRSLVGMLNFWKAGVCLGLFVDAFKLGS